jgi:hypothetical protein
MIAQNSGSIVCISSVSAQRGGGILGGPHYSAAKAGVLGLARAMAREYGGNNIRVNCVTPGLIATDINKGKIPEEKRQAILDGIPLGHIGEPNDVAGCVVFLASSLSKYCTGVTLDVNGGMLIQNPPSFVVHLNNIRRQNHETHFFPSPYFAGHCSFGCNNLVTRASRQVDTGTWCSTWQSASRSRSENGRGREGQIGWSH